VPAIASGRHFADSLGIAAENAMTSQGTMLGLQRAERPEQIGLSSERLDRITATFSADAERSAIPGAMLAIARAGRIGYGRRSATATAKPASSCSSTRSSASPR